MKKIVTMITLLFLTSASFGFIFLKGNHDQPVNSEFEVIGKSNTEWRMQVKQESNDQWDD